MQYSLIAMVALLGLTVAAPRPQEINISAAKELDLPSVLGPDMTLVSATASNYNPSSAASEAAAAISTDPAEKRHLGPQVQKRAACEREPAGNGPIPGDGSVEAYLDPNGILGQTAQQASTPNGYINTFTNLQASTQQIGYLTFKTLEGDNYDVGACAAFCDSEEFCDAFNIYFERDPSVDPAAECPNPIAVTNIKCSLYGYALSEITATNRGQFRGPEDGAGRAFEIVIAGSNGYSRTAPQTPDALANFTGPSALLRGAINAPTDNGTDTYIGMKIYNDAPYDPSLCAAACQAQTAYNRITAGSNGTYHPCNFFNSYVLSQNGVPLGTYCSFYSRAWGDVYANNTGNGEYVVEQSYTFYLTIPDPGHF